MSTIQVHGIEDGWVRFSDNGGPTELPIAKVPMLADKAIARDDAHEVFDGRRYDRGDLVALRIYLEQIDRCENRTATWQCEERATENMGDGKRFCAGCRSSASGSGYDDREDVA